MNFTASQIAKLINGKIEGNPDSIINDFCTINESKKDSITFLYSSSFISHFSTTKASVVLINENLRSIVKSKSESPTIIWVSDARISIGVLLDFYQNQTQKRKLGKHKTAVIEKGVEIGKNVYIGAFVYIAKGTKIGDNTIILSHTSIFENVEIGSNTKIDSNVTIYAKAIIGNECIIQSGTRVGSEGFGFQPNSENNYKKITHIGNVIIEDYVEIGSNTTIDRGTIGSTIIKKGVKIDNLVQIAHNCNIGENTVIAAQTGISGSSIIKNNCIIAGQVGIGGHIKIGQGVKIGGQSGITRNVKDNEIISGTPVLPYIQNRKSNIVFKRLPDMEKKIHELEKKIRKLENNNSENER